MTNSKDLIRDYEFNDNTPKSLIDDDFYVDWPVVYVINNDKEMYIGETYHSSERMKQHLKLDERRKLNNLHIIGSSNFTKSATLDIESSLIELCKLENKRILQNANDGIVNHNFANKDSFRKDSIFFADLWKQLKEKDLVEGNIENILNSDLFKYSPYKSLNAEQCTARDYILEEIEECLKNNKNKSIFVNGSAGTGKTILAIYLMKLLATNQDYLMDKEDESKEVLPFVNTLMEIKKTKKDLKVAYVVAMGSLRETLKNVFKSIRGLKANMVIGPNEVLKKEYDVLIVDEAHRLKQRKNLGNSFNAFDKVNHELGFSKDGNQLDWIVKRSKVQILFYDVEQCIKPTDVDKSCFDKLLHMDGNSLYNLSSQMRCIAGADYINYVKDILNERQEKRIDFNDKYELCLFDDINKFCDAILEKEKTYGLSRIISGYGFKWDNGKVIEKLYNKKKPPRQIDEREIRDVKVGDKSFYWNRWKNGWPLLISGDEVINEVGCVHTIQGYDLNYCGVIFGPEIIYRDGHIQIKKEKYFDTTGKYGASDIELKKYIINIYSVLLTRGIKGTFIYVCDESLRDYLKKYF